MKERVHKTLGFQNNSQSIVSSLSEKCSVFFLKFFFWIRIHSSIYLLIFFLILYLEDMSGLEVTDQPLEITRALQGIAI